MPLFAEIVGGIVLLAVFLYGASAVFNYFMKARDDAHSE